MPRLTAALAAALIVVAALAGSLSLAAQAPHGAEPLYTTTPAAGEDGNTTTTTLTTTVITMTSGSTTVPGPTPTQPSCMNESMVGALYSGSAIYGKGVLATCLDSEGGVEVEFYFRVSGDEVEYGGVVKVRGGSIISVYSNPLGISLVTRGGETIILTRPSGDRVNVSDYYRFKYTSSIPSEVSGVLHDASSVVVEMPFNATGFSFTLRGAGKVELYIPSCSLDVKVILNKTESRVDVPQGYRGVTLEAPGDENVSLSVLAYNEGGSAIVYIMVYAKADHAEVAAGMAVSAMEWLWSRGILQGVSEEDLSGASQAVAGVVSEFCGRGSSLSIIVYWNGTAWEWVERPIYVPTMATPRPTPTTTTASPLAVKTERTAPTTSPETRLDMETGAVEARRAVESGMTSTPLNTGSTSVAGAAMPVGLLAGITVGVVAALVAWLLVRRV